MHVRVVTPGGKAAEDAEGGGWFELLAETAARRSFKSTSTRPGSVGNIALYMGQKVSVRERNVNGGSHIDLLHTLKSNKVFSSYR